MSNTLRDWAVQYATKESGGQVIIEDLIKASGLLATMPFRPATHNSYHRYTLANNLPTGGFRALNGSLVPNNPTQKIQQEDLFELAQLETKDPTYIKDLGISVEEAFAMDTPQTIEGMSQTLAKQFFYGTTGAGSSEGFIGLRELAVSNGNVQSMGGAEGSSSTMFIVRWQPNVMEGLFNPEFLNTGQLITSELLHGGETYAVTSDTATGAQKMVKGALYQSYLGLLKAGAYNVAVITNIEDSTGHKPTAAAIDKAIEQVNGYSHSGNTFIYCNSRVYRLTGELKNSKLQSLPESTEFSRRLDTWDGLIPIVIDDNITNTENYS